MSHMDAFQVVGAFLGLQNRYWAIIIIVIIVIIGLAYYARNR